MATPIDLRNARVIVQRALAPEEQVARCLNDLKEGPGLSLLDLMIQRGFLTEAQAQSVRDSAIQEERAQEDVALGHRVVEQGFATLAQVTECRAIIDDLRRKGNFTVPRVGQLLLAKGYVTEEDLGALLAADEAAPVPRAESPLPTPPERRAASPTPPRGTPTAPAGLRGPLSPAPARGATTPTPPRGAPSVAPPALAGTIPRSPAAAARLRCVFCGIEVRDGAARRPCPGCKETYHHECWQKAGGCIHADCSSHAASASSVRSAKAPAAPTSPRAKWIAAAAAAGALLIAAGLWLGLRKDARDWYELALAADPRPTPRVWTVADLRPPPPGAEPGPMALAESAGRGEKKVEHLRRALELDARFASAWRDLGFATFDLGRWQESAAALEKAVGLARGEGDDFLVLGAACERAGDARAAEGWYRKAAEADAARIEPREMLAFLYLEKMPERRADAIVEIEVVIARRPENVDLAQRLLDLLIAEKRTDRALALLEQLEKRSPGSPGLGRTRAELLYAQGKWAEALAAAEQVARQDQRADEARRIQALALEKLGRGSEAFFVAKEIWIRLGDPEVFLLTGDLALRYGEADLGSGCLRAAYDKTRRPEILERYADTLVRMGRCDEARAAYEELRSVSSTRPGVPFKIAFAAAEGADRGKAVALVKEMRARDASDPLLAALAARLQCRTGEVEAGLARLKEVVAANPTCGFARLQLGTALREAGQGVAALNELRAVLALADPDPEAHFEIGQAYLALKKPESAREAFAKYAARVTFGRNFERAKPWLEGGSVPTPVTGLEPGSGPLQVCSQIVAQIGEGGYTHPWLIAGAALHACAGMAWSLTEDATKAQSSAMAGWNLVNQLKTSANARPPSAPEIERWLIDGNTAWTALGDGIAAVIARRDAAKVEAPAVNRILEERKNRLDGASSEEAGAILAHAAADLVHRLLLVLADAPDLRTRIEEIESLREIQIDVCTNELQTVCAEMYALVGLFDLLLVVQDRQKAHVETERAILKRFEQREARARTVAEQIRNAATALAELLHPVASDPALRP